MNVRRYKCKRHVALALRQAGLWLVYDSENDHHLPILHKLPRARAAERARGMNRSGTTFYPGGEDRRQRDLRLARAYYQRTASGSPTDMWGTYGEAHVAAAERVTREDAFRPQRALDLGF